MHEAFQRVTRRVALAGVVVIMGALLAGCGDGGDGGDRAAADEVDASKALASAGADALAAAGSELDEPPGPEDRESFDGFGEVAVAVEAPDGSVLGWCVLVADDPELRGQGLMEVTDLGGYAGMLFVWDADSTSSFYMRNTPMPLSIAWFDAAGEYVSTADMEPCDDVDDCPLYPSAGPYRFALEVPQGELATLGVEEGSVLRVGGDCAARSP